MAARESLTIRTRIGDPQRNVPSLNTPLDHASRPQAWLQQHERSSIFTIRILVSLTLTLGRATGRALLYPVCSYFMVFTPAARRA